jgi:hypothetical protein
MRSPERLGRSVRFFKACARALLKRDFDASRRKLNDVPENLRDEAKDVLGTEDEIRARESGSLRDALRAEAHLLNR